MNRLDVLDGVRHVIRQHLNIAGPIDPETDMLREWQLDSIKQLTLVVELENHFRICFEAGDEQDLVTVGQIVDLVSSRLARQTLSVTGVTHDSH